MSLDTVLKIGKTFREAENNMEYFKYIEKCPTDSKGNYPLCVTIPINSDNSIDWDNVRITPENERDKLYYLKYKTSDSDGLVKYIYGDIYYEKSATIKKDEKVKLSEGGYYRLSNPMHTNAAYRNSSYIRGESDYKDLVEKLQHDEIEGMNFLRDVVGNNLNLIERLLAYSSGIEYYFSTDIKESFDTIIFDENKLKEFAIRQNLKQLSKTNIEKMKSTILELSNSKIFLHFELPNSEKKYWYQYKTQLSIISQKMLSEFVEQTNNGFVLKKTIYKTLCSGDDKNDIQFPNFRATNKHKSKSFTDYEVQNLFYALSYTNKGKLIAGTDIKFIVLPCGDNLTKDDYESFQKKGNENQIVTSNEFSDSLFDFADLASDNVTSFDLIFSKKGGLTSPDKDLIEISGIEKSKLRATRERIHTIAYQVFIDRKKFIGTEKDLSSLSIEYSFRNLLGNPLFDQKTGKVKFEASPKFQSHLLKVLPLIYNDNYYTDDELLSSFVQNNEYAIRSGDSKYGFLKFDLIFLLKIQNNKNDRYMAITESNSYQIGLMLGALAKQLSQEINSFEKNYVGTLSRRISTISDFIKLKTDIEQKLIMHDKSKYTFQISYDLAQKIKDFGTKYDKDECAFGFMESYFKPLPKSETSKNNGNVNN